MNEKRLITKDRLVAIARSKRLAEQTWDGLERYPVGDGPYPICPICEKPIKATHVCRVD